MLARLRDIRSRRRSLRELAHLDARTLADIGLSRSHDRGKVVFRLNP
nr:DUF1127 domain-containing protein [Methylobacterium crusticola]